MIEHHNTEDLQFDEMRTPLLRLLRLLPLNFDHFVNKGVGEKMGKILVAGEDGELRFVVVVNFVRIVDEEEGVERDVESMVDLVDFD